MVVSTRVVVGQKNTRIIVAMKSQENGIESLGPVWLETKSKKETLCHSLSLYLSLPITQTMHLSTTETKKKNKAIQEKHFLLCFYEYCFTHFFFLFVVVTHMHSYRSRQKSRQNTKWTTEKQNKTETFENRLSHKLLRFRVYVFIHSCAMIAWITTEIEGDFLWFMFEKQITLK